MQVSQKGKILSEYLFAFCKFRFTSEHFQKKMAIIVDVYLNLRTPEEVVR